MEIKSSLRRVLPQYCARIARMFGIRGEAYLAGAKAITTREGFKEWLQPLSIVLKHQKVHLSLRSNADELTHPEEMEAFSLVLLGKKGVELFRLEACATEFTLCCRGLYLPTQDLYGSRFDPDALINHLVSSKTPLEVFLVALECFGEPRGLRAKGEWLNAQKVVLDALDEMSPEQKTLRLNMAAFQKFVDAAYGGIRNFSGEIEYLTRSLRGPRGVDERPAGVIFVDGVLSIEISEGGLFINFDFACLAPEGDQCFSPGGLYKAARESQQPGQYVAVLFRVVRALKPLTVNEPGAEAMRQRILMFLNSDSEKTVVTLAQASA